MADFAFNIAKGKLAYYAGLPAANDALVVVPILAAGLEADPTLKDYTTLAALLAGTTDEQTTIGRVVVSAGVTVTIDNANDVVNIDMPDPVWTAASGAALGALIICYNPDTTAAPNDANLVPLCKYDFAVTPNGNDLTAVVNAAGFAKVQ